MRARGASHERTVAGTVLFCCLALAACAPATPACPFTVEVPTSARVTFTFDDKVPPVQGAHLSFYRLEYGRSESVIDAALDGRPLTTPVFTGLYGFTLTGGGAPAATNGNFSVRMGEDWVWHLGVRGARPSFGFYPLDRVQVDNAGPLRADPEMKEQASLLPVFAQKPDGTCR